MKTGIIDHTKFNFTSLYFGSVGIHDKLAETAGGGAIFIKVDSIYLSGNGHHI